MAADPENPAASAAPDFEELRRVSALADAFARHRGETPLRCDRLAEIHHRGASYPIHAFSLGNPAPDAPVLGFVGGVHGLERIGTQVVVSCLEGLVERLAWDDSLHWQLGRMRLICVPLLNPVGMHRRRRANGNDVDLMRNSPVRASPATPLLGGQTLSRHLPWFMGESGRMELESQALCELIERETAESRASILVDFHSGFGLVDRLWFPYARSLEPFPNLPEIYALKAMLDQAQPNHVYSFEPQSRSYVTHGDLWDHLHERHLARDPARERPCLPLTLEMGSWLWVKKNPRQLFSLLGAFNPMKPHRKKRVLRRHAPLLDFLMRATVSHDAWSRLSPSARGLFQAQASELWYR